MDDCAPCTDCCECEPPLATPRSLRRIAWALTLGTILWNSLEAVIGLFTGVAARSVALLGFGLDSVVETTSAVIVAWHLTRSERSEQLAVRLIALTFFGIAAYVVFEAVGKLAGWIEPPAETQVGMALVTLSLVVMPLLAGLKRRVAHRLGSVVLLADAAETQLCFYLSAIVLVGLAANVVLGWWWMDPLAALCVGAVALYEGQRAWAHGDLCGDGTRQLCGSECCPVCPLA
jgi:divalent metal cation (Fe/Co/Zn/Cd) transporter